MTRSLMLGTAAFFTACTSYHSYDQKGAYATAPSEPEMLEDDPQDPTTACESEEPVVLYASPDDSNSMSSPMQAWHDIESGTEPFNPIRTWEFFNYATWDYPAAEPGQLSVDLQLAQGDAPGTYAMQVGISSERIDPLQRAPMVLTFSVDQSGSMGGKPIRRVKDSLEVIASQLRPGDIVNLIGWSENRHRILEGHTILGPNDPVFLSAIRSLSTNGGTDLAGGLKAAYRLTEKHWVPGRIHRVVLLSDGGANIGVTDGELIGTKAGAVDEDGIYLIEVGVGHGSWYNDRLMNEVTDLGKGAAVFIPTRAAAEEVFGDRFLESMSTSARDVQIRYDLPPGFRIERFSGEEISEDRREIEPQHVAPNDAVVLYQHLASCAEPDLSQRISVTVSYYDGLSFEPRSAVVSATLGELLEGPNEQLLKGTALYAFTQTLMDAQDPLENFDPSEARATLDAALDVLPHDADLLRIQQGLDTLGL